MLCTLIVAIILSINIQVGLNMHLYDDIGDASSSLRGSTSSCVIAVCHCVFAVSRAHCVTGVSLCHCLCVSHRNAVVW